MTKINSRMTFRYKAQYLMARSQITQAVHLNHPDLAHNLPMEK